MSGKNQIAVTKAKEVGGKLALAVTEGGPLFAMRRRMRVNQ
jgi:hypothetical protein